MGLGWSVVIFSKQLLAAIPVSSYVWLLSGGISYTVGSVLYLIGKKKKYMHSVFHLFVVLGSVLHFISVLICFIGEGHNEMNFTVGFQVNTHGYVSGEGEGNSVLVRSRRDLEAFYAADRDGNKHLYRPCLAKYGDAFFESKALLLVTRQEGSGSVTLRVEGVDLVDGQPEARIARSAPAFGTMDMARWVIGIELDCDMLLKKGWTP